MSILDQEINFDVGHLVLLLALIGFLLFVMMRCKADENLKVGETAGCPAGVNVQPVHWKSCRCPDCETVALQQARNGELYGCNPNNPYVPYSKEECDYQYRKALLHGCNVA
jgi:hypothetical protein